MPKLAHKRLLEQLTYDEKSGKFTWNVTRHRIKRGDEAGSLTDRGYITIKVDGEAHKAHRLAWFYVHGVWPTGVIDHRNGVKNDNSIDNLRDTSQQVNCENQKNAKANGTCDLLGVSYVPKLNKYKAQITVKGEHKYLGVFSDPNEAHAAYMSEKRKSHKGFDQRASGGIS